MNQDRTSDLQLDSPHNQNDINESLIESKSTTSFDDSATSYLREGEDRPSCFDFWLDNCHIFFLSIGDLRSTIENKDPTSNSCFRIYRRVYDVLLLLWIGFDIFSSLFFALYDNNNYSYIYGSIWYLSSALLSIIILGVWYLIRFKKHQYSLKNQDIFSTESVDTWNSPFAKKLSTCFLIVIFISFIGSIINLALYPQNIFWYIYTPLFPFFWFYWQYVLVFVMCVKSNELLKDLQYWTNKNNENLEDEENQQHEEEEEDLINQKCHSYLELKERFDDYNHHWSNLTLIYLVIVTCFVVLMAILVFGGTRTHSNQKHLYFFFIFSLFVNVLMESILLIFILKLNSFSESLCSTYLTSNFIFCGEYWRLRVLVEDLKLGFSPFETFIAPSLLIGDFIVILATIISIIIRTINN